MYIKTLLGSDHNNPQTFGQYTLDTYDEHTGIAISVGGKSGCHGYKDLNEDSVGYAISDNFKLIIVADAYNGAKAGEIFVRVLIGRSEKLFAILKDNRSNILEKFREIIAETIYPISNSILNENVHLPHHDHNRSQLSILLVDRNSEKVFWGNFGDSRIYTTWKIDGSHLISPVDFRSLGHIMTKSAFMNAFKTGSFDVKKGAIVVCSDGFPEAKKPEFKPHIVVSWIDPYSDITTAIDNFMTKAFEFEACDNLSVGMVLVSDRQSS